MDQPEIAFFDMDYTVLDTDCEMAWKNLLADKGLAPEEDRDLVRHYIDLHAIGKTPAEEYLAFLLREFTGQTPEALRPLARENFETYAREKIYPQAIDEIASYNQRGIRTVLLSGSNRIIVEPVIESLGVMDVICTELETADGRFTGRIDGEFRIREGKLTGAEDYCRARGIGMEHCAFYGDSVSDVQILERAGWPYAVNPNEKLREIAEQRQWPILHWELQPV